ncbi:MAG: hypothetical protein GY805_24980, partial [Chloroflexi bacterium]|nr:hypothetical protein [Chloroflexota bacterium]
MVIRQILSVELLDLYLDQDLSLVEEASNTTTYPAATSFFIKRLDPSASQHFTVAIEAHDHAFNDALIRLEGKNSEGIVEVAAYATVWIRTTEATSEMPNGEAAEAPSATTNVDDPGGWIFRPIEPKPALFSGAATYSYPIEVPPARKGMGPSLGLIYNSRVVDGMQYWRDSGKYGEGWELSGIPFVNRDGAKSCNNKDNSVCFDGTFSLHLDGGSYDVEHRGESCGSNCQIYVANDAPGLRIEVRHDSAANAAGTYWTVRKPDGNVYQFGYHEDSEQVVTSPTTIAVRWFLDQLDDPFGNRMIVLYDDDEARKSNGDVCDGICREVDIWPTMIRYNNKGASPSRDDIDWRAEVRFGWLGTGSRVEGGSPIFRTRRHLASISTYTKYESEDWQAEWHYIVDTDGYNCYDATPYTSSCGNNVSLEILRSIQRVESTGASWPATTFEYYGEIEKDNAHTVGEHDYCSDSGCSGVKVKYPHLKLVRNGYGGVHRFTYQHLGWNNDRKSWVVSELEVWDGVENIYVDDDSTNSTLHQTFEYETPCYHQSGQCYTGPGDDTFKLVGHRTVYVNTYDANGFLSRKMSRFLDSGSGYYLYYGKIAEELVFNNETGTEQADWLQRTTYDYDQSVTTGSACPQTDPDTSFNWVCLSAHRTRQYFNGNAAEDTNEFYTYSLNAQGGRQWGLRTQTDYQHSNDGVNLYTVMLNKTKYVANKNSDHWVAAPWATQSWEDKGSGFEPVKHALYLYGTNTVPNEQILNRGDQLTWSRQLVNPGFCEQGSYDTVDTRHGYGSWGLPEEVFTYPDYGLQTVDCNTSWDPISSADLNRTGIPSKIKYADDYGLLVEWVENAEGHRTTFNYFNYGVTGETTALYPWQLTTKTNATGLATEYRYDTLGRLENVIGPESANESDPVMEYRYDLPAENSGNPIYLVEIANPAHGDEWSSNSIRRHTRAAYNGLGQEIESRVALAADEKLVTVSDRDGLGRVTCESLPIPANNGDLVPSGDCWNHPHIETRYDAAGRVSVIIAPDGTKTNTIYGNRSVYVQDGENHIKASFFDPSGRLTHIDEMVDSFYDTFAGDLSGWNKFNVPTNDIPPNTIVGTHAIQNEQLHIEKDAINRGQYGAIRASTLAGNDVGVSFAFKVTSTSSHSWFYLDSGSWNTPGYRSWGLGVRGDNLQLDEWCGKEYHSTEDVDCRQEFGTSIGDLGGRSTTLLQAKENTWYQAILRTSQDDDRYFTIVVWERNNPTIRAEIRMEKTAAHDWHRNNWRFTAKTSVLGNHIYLDDYTELNFNRTSYTYDMLNNLVQVEDAAGNTT